MPSGHTRRQACRARRRVGQGQHSMAALPERRDGGRDRTSSARRARVRGDDRGVGRLRHGLGVATPALSQLHAQQKMQKQANHTLAGLNG